MELNFGPRGIIEIRDAKITFCNFEGRRGDYNEEGDRNFCLIIPTQEMADVLIEQGYNVKIRPPREEFDSPFMYLKVNVNFDGYRPPSIYATSGRNTRKLGPETVGELDRSRIMGVDMNISPFHWNKGGRSGTAAYLQSLVADLEVDSIVARFADEEYPTE